MILNKPISTKVLFILPIITFVGIFIFAVNTSGDPDDGGGIGYVFALIAASISTFIVGMLVTIIAAIMSKRK